MLPMNLFATLAGADAFVVMKQTLIVLAPELIMILAATAMMTAGAFVKRTRQAWLSTTFIVLGVAFVALLAVSAQTTDPFSSVALNDSFSFAARLFLLGTAFILVALAHDQVDEARAAEFFGSLLYVNAGAMLVAAANELVFLFVALELVSIPTYLLLYLPRRNAATREAAVKYFYLSIFASAMFLFGAAYLYGLTGLSNLKAIGFLSARNLPNIPNLQVGLIAVMFLLAGLSFRVAAVPFHFYAPDVYEGSPTYIAALLAWIPKAVGFLAIIRVLTSVIAPGGDGAGRLIEKAALLAWVIAAATMTLGNLSALLQDNLRRLLAYSSIAHAGYMMIGVSVAFVNLPGAGAFYLGSESILFYLAAYGLMTLGVFGAILALSTAERPVETVDDLAGLAKSHPRIALAMAICLFSLAGIPPLAGFFGKFALFASAFSATRGDDTRMFQVLALVGVINSAIGAYYYLRIVVAIYLRPNSAGPLPRRGREAWPACVATGVCTALVVVFGMFPRTLGVPCRTAAVAANTVPAEPDVQPAQPVPVARLSAD